MRKILIDMTDEMNDLVEQYRVSCGYRTTSETLRELIAKGLGLKGYVYSGPTVLMKGRPRVF